MRKKIVGFSICLLLIGTFFVVAPDIVSADYWEDGFFYTVSGDVATVTGYNGTGGAITIPSTLGGYPVVHIGDSAFYDCNALNSVTIPDSVTTIGQLTFQGCETLTSVTIGNSVTSIGGRVFDSCDSLISITFLGLVAPSVGTDWIKYTPVGIRGHAYVASNFPAPGDVFYGLTMGAYINTPPIADFTYTPSSPTDLDVIQFTDTSTDAEGTITSWSWKFDDGTTSSIQNPTHQYTDDGTYIVTLTVTDDDGASNSISKDITVNNIPPVVFFTYNPSSPTDLEIIHFTDASIDDGTITSWSWDFGDGNTSTIQNPTHQFADDGSYLVNLTITDDDGASDSISQLVIVSNVPPVADANGPYAGSTGHAIDFDGSGSYDPDGDILSYQWTFGDGSTGTGVSPTHEYVNYSTYNVTLLVTDDDGVTNADWTIVLIIPETPPRIQLLYPTDGMVLKDTITVRWYAHDAIDGDNLPIYIYFKDVDDTLFKAFKNNSYSNNGTCKWDTTTLLDGTYQLLIVAVDSAGNIGADRCNFQINNYVEPPENLPPETPDTPSGSTHGKLRLDYTYTTSTTDPEGDRVYYLWDWGDGNTSGWLGPYNSGVTINTTYRWDPAGSYIIVVKAKDIHGHESSWSDPLPISMPYTYRPLWQFLDWLFQRFPNAFPILRQLLGY